MVIEDKNSLLSSVQFIETLSSDVAGVIDVDPRDPRELARMTEQEVIARPIEFHIVVPEKFMSIPQEYYKNSENGRHVSRSLMLSKSRLGGFQDQKDIKSKPSTSKAAITVVDPLIDSNRYTDSMLINHLKV